MGILVVMTIHNNDLLTNKIAITVNIMIITREIEKDCML